MSLASLRRRAAPIAAGIYVVFVAGLIPRPALAGTEREPEATTAPAVSNAVASEPTPSEPKVGAERVRPTHSVIGPESNQAIIKSPDKSGTSSQAITVPQGAGKIQGMGESFSAQLSTGIGTYSVPFSLPMARGAAQPNLGLSYSSSIGHGNAGVGWDIGVPFIARQTDRGVPKYNETSTFQPDQDRFIFNGGQELVPVCVVTGGLGCSGAVAGEVMPVWASGYMYFRARVEGTFLRFFWSPDHQTWRVQDKTGVSMELGVPLDDASYVDGLERDPQVPAHVFRWNLVRQYDSQGDSNPSSGAPAPSNAVVYRYAVIGGVSHLVDLFDTPPASNPSSATLSDYAHHTRLSYELRSDPTTDYRRGWPVQHTLRVTQVDVTSKTFGNGGARELVRRYHLSYDPAWHPSLLTSVQLEGRCAQPVTESQSQSLPTSNCPTLPALTFGYQHVSGFDIQGNSVGPDLTGYEAFDERLHTMSASPAASLNALKTDLFDVNSDALPDVLQTDPAQFNGYHGVYFNGAGGVADQFGLKTMSVASPIGDTTSTLSWDNFNVNALDVDGDGITNFLHMPVVKTYAVYTPTLGNNGWFWDGRAITTASQQSPKIDFGKDATEIRVMDVDGDGLVDVVRNAGTEFQTFFSLGRYPDGDGQYGHAAWTGPTSAFISNDPVAKCVPWSGTPIAFSDGDIKVGDMNGDGFPDLVRVRKGDVRYWPGRGNGVFGTGGDCPASTYGVDRSLVMTSAPNIQSLIGDSLRLDDVNGDGLDDLVQVTSNDVHVWLNVDGTGFTSEHHIYNAPYSPSYADVVRLVDVNGSGTRDVLYGIGGNYKYMDLAGGSRPWVLTHADNGLGKTTDIDYSTSTAQMLAAEKAGSAWSRKAPMVLHVVSKVTEHDNLGVVGRPDGVYTTTYEYRDPVYDGRQREFRGFTTARATRLGDANSPTATTESTFLLGDCKDETPNDNIDECSMPERWRDNPREALKGLPILSETYDANSVTLSTTHNTYRLRQLYTGLDGRVVRHAFHEQTDAFVYDTGPFQANPSTTTLPEVNLEATLGQSATDITDTVTVRSNARAHIRSSTEVDAFGNATDATADGCVDGCPTTDEAITTYTTPGRRNDDATGWMYRTVETYTAGSLNPTDKRQHHFMTYDVSGNLTESTADLGGTLPLDRFHQSNKPVAPTPPNSSQDGTVTVSTQTYDGFGNLTAQTAPNGRCRAIDYDAPFAQFATTETVFAGALSGNCGAVALQASAAYDRGLGLVTQVQDLHNELTYVTYDGFGRLVSLFKPDPNQTSTLSPLPSVKVEYFLTTNPKAQPYSLLHTQTQDGSDPSVSSYRDAWAYVDGMGRTIVTLDQADPGAGDGGDFVVNGLTDYDLKGAVERVYLAWFYSGSPTGFPLNIPAATKSSRQRYDAFGRLLERYNLDGTIALRNVYHALSEDAYDAADLSVGPHAGTYATARKDGHGRVVSAVERIHVGMALEARETKTQYLPTGEPIVITRQRGNDTVTRWMRYDSLGRMVLNVEPNVTKNFNPDPSTDPSTMKAWRYAYDDNGDLAGTSDARGCGSNYHYDAAGRIVAEDYSPCLDTQQAYSQPDFSTLNGIEVYYLYDFSDPDAASIPNFPIDSSLLRGRLVSVSDRASKTLTRFDGRGRVTGIARRVAVPGQPAEDLSLRYAPRWYTQVATFDGADRPASQSTGAQVAELLGSNQQSFVTTDYTKRGTVKHVGSSYGDLVTHVYHDADGLPTQIQYGDLAQTTTDFGHDDRRRLRTVQTYRGPPADWTSPPSNYTPAPEYGSGTPSTFQLVLEDAEFTYDEVDNPVEIHDWRNPSDWPAGAKPVTRKAQYDDLYRLTKIDYQYSTGDDTWVDPFDNEDTGQNTDPRRAMPSPHVSFDKRVLSQSYQYDWLGNITNSSDDAAGFYDRSLGAQTHNPAKPYQLTGATGATSTRDGSLTVAYDDAGNMTSMALERNGPCMPTTGVCSQRFVYDWDEVGRLARARRWDVATPGLANDPVPVTPSDVELRYAYDAGDQRVLKTAVDPQQNERHTVYVFASLELRRAPFETGDYDDTRDTEVPYLFAHGVRLARLHYAKESLPTLTSGHLHVLLELPDYLGSAASIIDMDTGELVEKHAYQPYGSTESDYRPSRWDAFREDYRFTSKEDDIEVGAAYFGKRYLLNAMGRWASPDPLAIHNYQSDLNAYAYVHGRTLRQVDPAGLDEDPQRGVSFVGSGAATDEGTQARTSSYSAATDALSAMEAKPNACYARCPGPPPAPIPAGPNQSIGAPAVWPALPAAPETSPVPEARQDSSGGVARGRQWEAQQAEKATQQYENSQSVAGTWFSPLSAIAAISAKAQGKDSHEIYIWAIRGVGIWDIAAATSGMGQKTHVAPAANVPLKSGDMLPATEIVVLGNNAPGNFRLRPGVDTSSIGGVATPGKSVTIATDLTLHTEIRQMFGRPVKPGDILSGGFVEDIRAAGFDVVFAPTPNNPLHARIVPGLGIDDANANTFDAEGTQWLNLATDRLQKAGNR